jgi:regulator of protease activity HflC (stomatin/prohibitin superfamily)
LIASPLQVTSDTAASIILIFIFLIIIIAFLRSAIKIIREYERILVFRLGRAIGVKGPGVVLVMPIIDKTSKIDLRERFIEVSKQTAITKDNAPTDIDFLIYFRVVDAAESVLRVENFVGASVGVATTTLRAVVGDIPLDELLARREQINTILRTKLDEVTERWGIKITTVEIREITPPKDVQEAMVRQMSAERSRRAMILEADGKRESAILVAEGDKKSSILKAEGERQAEILKAEGFAQALETVFKAAKGIDQKTMIIQYLDTLRQVGSSPSTKFVFPMELTALLAPLRAFMEGISKEGSEEKKD